MANKNFLARGVQRTKEPDGTPKLTEPRVVTFGFKNFKIVEKDDNKWQAECRSCRSVIVESRGTTSGFVRHIQRKHTEQFKKYQEEAQAVKSQTSGNIGTFMCQKSDNLSSNHPQQIKFVESLAKNLIIRLWSANLGRRKA